MKIETFEDVESWKKARELVKSIYLLTNKNPFLKDFGIKDQIQRAAVSVMSNIAEGFDSGTNKSYINFLNYSYRSASEVQSLLYVANDLEYISNKQFTQLHRQLFDIKNLIGGFIQYLKKQRTKH